jgi:hypothetical protein
MAFPRRSTPADEIIDPHGPRHGHKPITTLPIVPFADDPECQRLSAQSRVLQRGIDERETALELYAIANELTGVSTLASGPRKTALRERADHLRAKLPSPKAEPGPVDGIDPVVAVGLKLAAGEILPAPRDEAAHKTQLRTELQQIRDALRLVNAQFDDLRATRSGELAEKLLPQQRAILRSKLDAALALCAACAAERSLIAEVLTAGYEHYPGVWTSPPLDGATRLGTTDEWHSQINDFRRALEYLKVI